MKKILFLLVCLLVSSQLHAQIYYWTSIADKSFRCISDEQGVYCDLPEEDSSSQSIWLEQPHTAPGTLQPHQEKESIKNFLYKQGYNILQFNEMECKRPDAKVFSFVSANKNRRILQGIARADQNTLALLMQELPNRESLGNNFIFTHKVANEICYLDLPLDTIFLFGKSFICQEQDMEGAYSSSVFKLECKLEEKDPLRDKLFISRLYKTEEPVFHNPKQFLSETMTGVLEKDECKTKKIFSCPQKNRFIGVCNDGTQEIVFFQSPSAILTLFNQDLAHSIVDKKHREELCNVNWGRRQIL